MVSSEETHGQQHFIPISEGYSTSLHCIGIIWGEGEGGA